MKKHPLIIALLICTLYACKKKEGPTGPQGAAGPAGTFGFTGAIAGHISLYDQNGVRLTNNLNGVKVSLNDSMSTLTDSTGRYIFTNVITGNYNIKISQAGYGNTQTGNFAFLKDTLYKDGQMTQLPDSNAAYIRINRFGNFDFVNIGISRYARSRYTILFVGKSPQVSKDNYMLYYISLGNIQISINDYIKTGIFYEDTIYYALYSYVKNDYSSYIDDKTGKMIFTAVGSKPVYDTMLAP